MIRITKKYELRLCPNGEYYLWEDNELIIPYIYFDAFNKENANQLVKKLNEQEEQIKRLKQIREEQIETILKLKRCDTK